LPTINIHVADRQFIPAVPPAIFDILLEIVFYLRGIRMKRSLILKVTLAAVMGLSLSACQKEFQSSDQSGITNSSSDGAQSSSADDSSSSDDSGSSSSDDSNSSSTSSAGSSSSTGGSGSSTSSTSSSSSSSSGGSSSVAQSSSSSPQLNAGDVDQLIEGTGHACAITVNGRMRCWGQHAFGNLGQDNDKSYGMWGTPMATKDIVTGGAVEHAAVGTMQTCFKLKSGPSKCFGSNGGRQLGYGMNPPVAWPTNFDFVGDEAGEMAKLPALNLPHPVKKFAIGREFICALLTNGKVKCWGDNKYGQLGVGHTNAIINTAEAPDLNFGGQSVTDIAAGGQTACAVLANGSVKCWGRNQFGQLGLGHKNNLGGSSDSTPNNIPDLNFGSDKIRSISLGTFSGCAVTTTNKARCWGYNVRGVLGYNRPFTTGLVAFADSENWVKIDQEKMNKALGIKNTKVAATKKPAAGRKIASADVNLPAAESIGDNAGEGPGPALNLGGDVKSVSVSAEYACAHLANNSVKCWGENSWGQLGYGSKVSQVAHQIFNDPGQYNHNGKFPFQPDASKAVTVQFGDAVSGKPGVVKTVGVGNFGGGRTCVLFDVGVVRCFGLIFKSSDMNYIGGSISSMFPDNRDPVATQLNLNVF
jgi:alpha-tubulin suppressor-like RCC1 family protein